MKALLLSAYQSIASNPAAVATLSVLAAGIATHYGFQVTPAELAGLALLFTGGVAHKAHTAVMAMPATPAPPVKEIEA
jgi:hypothetical protein